MFPNVDRPDTYGELATWIWLSIVPFHRCVTIMQTLLPTQSVTSFMDDTFYIIISKILLGWNIITFNCLHQWHTRNLS